MVGLSRAKWISCFGSSFYVWSSRPGNVQLFTAITTNRSRLPCKQSSQFRAGVFDGGSFPRPSHLAVFQRRGVGKPRVKFDSMRRPSVHSKIYLEAAALPLPNVRPNSAKFGITVWPSPNPLLAPDFSVFGSRSVLPPSLKET